MPSLKALRKQQLYTILPRLSDAWLSAVPGQLFPIEPTDKWWACALPPWTTVLCESEDEEVTPVRPAAWAKTVGIPLEEPGPRAKPQTHNLWAAGQEFLSTVQQRVDEGPPTNHNDLFFTMMRRAGDEGLDIAVDLETTGLDPDVDDIVGISVAIGKEGKVYQCDYWPFHHLMGLTIEHWCQDYPGKLVGWNSIFDERFLNAKGYAVRFTDDAKIMAWVTNIATVMGLPTGGEEGRAPSLKEAATAVLGVRGVPFKKVLAAWDAKDIRDVPWIAQRYYGACDAEWTLKLYYHLNNLLDTPPYTPRSRDVYESELRLFPIIKQMMKGIRLDRDRLAEHLEAAKEEREDILDEIRVLSGLHMDAVTRREIRAAVYRDRVPLRYTPTKQEPALDKKTLVELGTPLADALVKLSGVDKIINAVLQPLTERGVDWFKPDWRSFGTWSGRFSGNLQQLPLTLKDIFIPDADDHVFVVADYGQLELRVAAALSCDEAMIEILNDPNRSIHTEVQQMFNLPEKRLAKNLNFGAIYGGEKQTLARQSGCTEDEADRLIKQHKAAFPKLWGFRSEWIAQCRQRGYSITMDGRIRLLPNLRSYNKVLRSEAERQAFNHLIQGSGAGLAKQCMYDIWEETCGNWYGIRLVAQEHDALIYSVPASGAQHFCSLLQATGETDALFPVKLVFEPHAGRNWKEAKPE